MPECGWRNCRENARYFTVYANTVNPDQLHELLVCPGHAATLGTASGVEAEIQPIGRLCKRCARRNRTHGPWCKRCWEQALAGIYRTP